MQQLITLPGRRRHFHNYDRSKALQKPMQTSQQHTWSTNQSTPQSDLGGVTCHEVCDITATPRAGACSTSSTGSTSKTGSTGSTGIAHEQYKQDMQGDAGLGAPRKLPGCSRFLSLTIMPDRQ
jgi:hypothetical protein